MKKAPHLSDLNPRRRSRAPLRRYRLPGPLEDLHLALRLAARRVLLFPLREGGDLLRTGPL